ncbi:hypothetical protein LTR17_013658 [Elasticomyces elasticus]|nr:hypothetical protein LTR17_013658 [Elasticomyces elasticus]
MAAVAALAVVELLENILINLNFHDLLAARAASQQWRSVVSQSIALRKILFLAPISDTVIEVDKAISRLINKNHPVTLTAQPSDTHPLFRNTSCREWTLGGHNNTSAEFSRLPVSRLNSDSTTHVYYFTWSLEAMRGLRQSGLYQAMYLVQPPCNAVELTALLPNHLRCQEVGWFSNVTLLDLDGIRLGMIMRTAELMFNGLEEHRGSEVVIRFRVQEDRG